MPPSGSCTASLFKLAYYGVTWVRSRDMKISSSYGGHSALVRMRLRLNGLSFRIAQMGPDFLFVESPGNHPPTRATIELQVDDSQRAWEVDLPHGMSAGDERVSLGVIG
jgi:hypothetical protein